MAASSLPDDAFVYLDSLETLWVTLASLDILCERTIGSTSHHMVATQDVVQVDQWAWLDLCRKRCLHWTRQPDIAVRPFDYFFFFLSFQKWNDKKKLEFLYRYNTSVTLKTMWKQSSTLFFLLLQIGKLWWGWWWPLLKQKNCRKRSEDTRPRSLHFTGETQDAVSRGKYIHTSVCVRSLRCPLAIAGLSSFISSLSFFLSSSLPPLLALALLV